jgi:hypothetical protein
MISLELIRAILLNLNCCSLVTTGNNLVQQQGGFVMSVSSHIEHLQDKHRELEIGLAIEMAHPLPNFTAVKEIKKQKLLIKEEIARLMQGISALRHDTAS